MLTPSEQALTPFEQAMMDKATNQGKPGYDIFGNSVAGIPLKGGGAASQENITAGNLTPAEPIVVPSPTADTTNHNATIAGGNGIITANQQAQIDALKAAGTPQSSIDSLIASFTTPNTNANAYDTATGTTEESRNKAMSDAQLAKNNAEAAVRAGQAEVAGYQAQIKAVTDQRDAQNLKLEQTINQGSSGVGGAGAMASGSFLNVRQQEINRQAAIAALPLQALALASQAKLLGLQGLSANAADTLKQAQDTFDKAFQLKIDDNNRLYQAQQANSKAIYDFLTEREKNQLAKTNKTQADNLSQVNAAINDASNAAQSLLAKQPKIAAQIHQVVFPQPNDPNFVANLKIANDKVAAIEATVQASKPIGIGAGNNIIITDSAGKNVTIPVDVAPYYNTATNGVAYADLSAIQGTAAEKKAIVDAAQAAGIKVITNKNTAADLGNIKDANAKLDSISTIMTGIDQPGWISRALYGFGLTKLSAVAQSNPQQAAAGALQSIGLDILKAISGVQGFRGNQTAVQQVTDHLPSIYDTNAVVQQKIDYIRTLISDREQGLVGKSATQNQTGTAPQKLLQPSEIPTGYYQASDGLLYKK